VVPEVVAGPAATEAAVMTRATRGRVSLTILAVVLGG
jgi:hypothetical protein